MLRRLAPVPALGAVEVLVSLVSSACMWSVITALAYMWLKLCTVSTSVWFWKKIVPSALCYCDLQDESSVSCHPPDEKEKYQLFCDACFWSKAATTWTLLLKLVEGIIPERLYFKFVNKYGQCSDRYFNPKARFCTILPLGRSQRSSRKIRTVGINNLMPHHIQQSQGVALQHCSTD